MRFPIPNRIKPRYALLFICFIFAGQIGEGTIFLFALLTATYNLLWVLAFNVSGGLEYPSGAFILANGLYSVIVGMSAKVLLGEAGQRNMLNPITTMLCYCLGMLMMLLVCLLTRILRPERALLKGFASYDEINIASIVCLASGFFIVGLTGLGGAVSDGSVLSAVHQLTDFPTMAIVLATTYQIHKTNGRRSINWVTGISLGIGIFYTLVYFGKTSILVGFLTWSVTCVIQGYNFKRLQLVGLAAGAFVMFYYIVPYSQYVRTLKSDSVQGNIPIAIEYLSDLGHTRQLYYDSLQQLDVEDEVHFFDEREGFLDRLIILAADDELINFTAEGHVFGLTPTIVAYSNIVPRIVWKNKPSMQVGNAYAHELGNVLADEDTSTGIAFSATADAFHQASWLGILTLLPVSLFLCFVMFDSIAGKGQYSPFAILSIIMLFNTGGESGLEGPVHAATYGIFGLLAIAWTTKVAGPFLRNIVRRRLGDGARPGSGPRVMPVAPSGAEQEAPAI